MARAFAKGEIMNSIMHYAQLVGKGQNPLHEFPRSKSVTSWQLPRLRLQGSYGETCVMDFERNRALAADNRQRILTRQYTRQNTLHAFIYWMKFVNTTRRKFKKENKKLRIRNSIQFLMVFRCYKETDCCPEHYDNNNNNNFISQKYDTVVSTSLYATEAVSLSSSAKNVLHNCKKYCSAQNFPCGSWAFVTSETVYLNVPMLLFSIEKRKDTFMNSLVYQECKI